MIPIDIDTDTFDAASAVFGRTIGPQLAQAGDNLLAGLSGSGAMAGSDEAGVTWARSYDTAVGEVVPAISDAATASYRMAVLLQQTGFNHGLAESASTRGAVHATTDKTTYAGLAAGAMPLPASAAGGSGASPHGWGLIQHYVGYAWPNGHQDRLRNSASAWTAMNRALLAAGDITDEASEAIASQRSPEIDGASRACNAMRAHYRDIAAACTDLSDACTSYAGHLDKAHSDVEHQLAWLLGSSVAIQAIGGVVSFFSAGIAEAPTQAIELSRIEAAAAAVADILSTLTAAARTVALQVELALDSVAAVVPGLRTIIGLDAVEAEVTAVASAPATAAVAAERAAVTALQKSAAEAMENPAIELGASPWARGWSERGLSIEDVLGGNLPRSFPTIDKFENGVATSIKSIDLGGKTYQRTSALATRLRGYVDKVAEFKGKTFDGTRISQAMIKSKQLQVAVAPGAMSAAQRTVFDEMSKYASSRGVTLIISEVP